MTTPGWVEGFAGAVVVTDSEGRIIYMNDAAAENFRDQGGGRLVGESLFSCHNETSNAKIRAMLEKAGSHIYTVQSEKSARLVVQYPWYDEGEIGGLVEITFTCRLPLPHRNRGGT